MKMLRAIVVLTLTMALFIIPSISVTLSETPQLEVDQVIKQLQMQGGDELFEVLSPHNYTIWKEKPLFAYKAYGNVEELHVWLNQTEYPDISNNSLLPVTFRGCYNLTIEVIVSSVTIQTYIYFTYIPNIEVSIKYSALYVNNNTHPVAGKDDRYDKPQPVYLYNETVTLYAHFNEENTTLKISILYGDYGGRDYPWRELIEGANYTWINSTDVKIIMQPVNQSIVFNRLIFLGTSMLDDSTCNITFVFNRVYGSSIYIYISQYEDLSNLKGYVFLPFIILVGMIPAINISVYLDGQLIKEMYTPQGSFHPEGYFMVDIDTTAYNNGQHLLEIYGLDLFNFTFYTKYWLTFANPMSNAEPTNTNEVISPLSLATFLIVLLTLSVYSIKRRSKS